MRKILSLTLLSLGLNLALAGSAQAVCPICTIAVGAGVGLSRWLGIDDAISGLWVGGLVVSMIIWTISWLDAKNWRFRGMVPVTVAGYYLLVVAPLYYSGMAGYRLLLGIAVGSAAFWFGAEWYRAMKARNGGHAYFPFQKVVMPISPLVIMSLMFYFLTK